MEVSLDRVQQRIDDARSSEEIYRVQQRTPRNLQLPAGE
jgi:hypothetical protein